jgi:hypothetical protein
VKRRVHVRFEAGKGSSRRLMERSGQREPTEQLGIGDSAARTTLLGRWNKTCQRPLLPFGNDVSKRDAVLEMEVDPARQVVQTLTSSSGSGRLCDASTHLVRAAAEVTVRDGSQ